MFGCLRTLMAHELYVSPTGSDEASGSIDAPFRSLPHAQSVVRSHDALGKEPITVFLREGTYYLQETFTFTAADSGSAEAPVTYRAYETEEVVISGGLPLDVTWEPYRDGILQANVSTEGEIDQLFVNAERQHMARYPNFDPEAKAIAYGGHAADAFSPERAATWSDPVGGYIHAMHSHLWGGYHYRITGKDSNKFVSYEGGWQNNRQMGMHDELRFVENIFEELDAPGEWFHDRKKGILYFYPPEGFDLKTATIETAVLAELIEFKGTQEAPARFVNLKGLTFRHAARTFMDNKEPLLRSDWTIYRGGAVFANGAEDILIADCEFAQMGGNAIFVNKYNRRIHITGAHIYGTGASAVAFVGSPDAVRSPLFEYEERQAYEDLDLTPGPKSDDYPADCVLEDSLIAEVGQIKKQGAGVQISMSKGITVRHCSIYETSRSGINISEGTFGGHIIEYCDIFDTVLETSDHGCFNSWGRDRYWGLTTAPQKALAELSLLDAEKTTIRYSRWRCDHGWDIDLDDGSSNYDIHHNLMLNRGLKLREGFHRTVYNNIAVNNTMHPHVWYPESHAKVTRNIWMKAYRPARMKEAPQFESEVDRNLFISEEDRTKFAEFGWDENSVTGDPLFVYPERLDFPVEEGSPAFEIGFENFPMDQFGVQKPELKAIARTPVVDALQLQASDDGEAAPSITWKGATLRALEGEEFSAFGVSVEDGGLHVEEVPKSSAAARAGLQEGDLLQKVNGTQVRTTKDLLSIQDQNRMSYSLVRGQAIMEFQVR